MRREEARARVRELAAADPEGFFETLYREAGRDVTAIPWADLAPNHNLTSWAGLERAAGNAAVVGCGLGDDAALLASRGLTVTAFDVSPSAIRWCAERWAGAARIDWRVADLFSLPDEWRGTFDLVFEAYTVQPLPLARRAEALRAVASLVAPGGTLLLLSRGRDDDEELDPDALPRPLSRADLAAVPLNEARFEDYEDTGPDGLVRRFRVEYHRDP